jgi:hypothetical protein
MLDMEAGKPAPKSFAAPGKHMTHRQQRIGLVEADPMSAITTCCFTTDIAPTKCRRFQNILTSAPSTLITRTCKWRLRQWTAAKDRIAFSPQLHHAAYCNDSGDCASIDQNIPSRSP